MPDAITRYITAKPGVRGGRPCVKGTRLEVDFLRERVTRDGFAAVLTDYPQLTEDQILAVMTASTRALRRIRLDAQGGTHA